MPHLNRSDLETTYLKWAHEQPGYAWVERKHLRKISHAVLSAHYFGCLNNPSRRTDFIREHFILPGT